jgi:hypothetical protein
MTLLLLARFVLLAALAGWRRSRCGPVERPAR